MTNIPADRRQMFLGGGHAKGGLLEFMPPQNFDLWKITKPVGKACHWAATAQDMCGSRS